MNEFSLVWRVLFYVLNLVLLFSLIIFNQVTDECICLHLIPLKKKSNTLICSLALYTVLICFSDLTDFREFEKLASEVLGFCCLKNRLLSHQLLVRELSQFGTSLLCLAEENILMDFLGQTCCQTKLSAIWKGRMALSTSWKTVYHFSAYKL